MIKTPHWPIPLGHKPIALGLERVENLLERLGNPQEKMPPTIHVAGTNGKGSTIATLKAIFKAAGYKTHRYTSPHLIHFNERIELAGKLIPDDYLYKVLETCRLQSSDIPITFFEGTTAAAMLAFSEIPADVVLLETGLGGRLDATNVVEKPLLTIITTIGYDHMEFLGGTLPRIAAEKAAIMRPGVPCVVAPQLPKVMKTIVTHAKDIGAPLYHAEHAVLPCPPSLPGAHQLINAKVALTAIDLISSSCGLPKAGAQDPDPAQLLGNSQDDRKFLITEQHIITGLQDIRWPARLQKLTIDGNEVWLDGGHNASAGEALAVWAADRAPITLICGMMNRKALDDFLKPMQPHIGQLIAIPIPGEEDCYTPEEIATIAKSLGIKSTTANNVAEALASTIHYPPSTTLIAGSLYLAGSVLAEYQ